MRTPKTPLLLGAGLLSAGLLGLTGTGTLSSVMAQVVTSPNTASLGRMVLELRSADEKADACSSADSPTDVFVCETVQPLSGRIDLLPGQAVQTVVTATNKGTVVPSSFTLSSAGCTPTGSPTDEESKKAFESICDQVRVRVTVADEDVFYGSVAKLGGTAIQLPPPRKDDSEDVVFTTSTSEKLGNGFQGLGVSVPMTWTFQQ